MLCKHGMLFYFRARIWVTRLFCSSPESLLRCSTSKLLHGRGDCASMQLLTCQEPRKSAISNVSTLDRLWEESSRDFRPIYLLPSKTSGPRKTMQISTFFQTSPTVSSNMALDGLLLGLERSTLYLVSLFRGQAVCCLCADDENRNLVSSIHHQSWSRRDFLKVVLAFVVARNTALDNWPWWTSYLFFRFATFRKSCPFGDWYVVRDGP